MLSIVLALTTFVGCSNGGGGSTPAPAENTDNLSEVQKIIAEAETMTHEELAKKAIE